MQRVEADAVNQFGRALDIPDSEITMPARFQRPDIVAAERAGGNAGDAGKAAEDVQKSLKK